jgi:hypothetical protein
MAINKPSEKQKFKELNKNHDMKVRAAKKQHVKHHISTTNKQRAMWKIINQERNSIYEGRDKSKN